VTIPDTPEIPGPVRTCIGCRRQATKSELLRLTVGSVDGHPAVVPDPTGTAPGRGAHLHPLRECYDLAVRRKAFARALRFSAQGGLSSAPVGEWLGSQTDDRHDKDRSTSS
jgi:uncharacterized protein